MQNMTDNPEKEPTFVQEVRAQLNYWWYYHVKRRSGNIGRRIIWALPKRVVYWCVIRAATKVEPNSDPSDVTAKEMLEKFDYN